MSVSLVFLDIDATLAEAMSRLSGENSGMQTTCACEYPAGDTLYSIRIAVFIVAGFSSVRYGLGLA